jgi:hypothetical protein
MGEVFPLHDFEEEGVKLTLPKGVPYTLLHSNEHGAIPVFLGSSEQTDELNEQARLGLFEIPSKAPDNR